VNSELEMILMEVILTLLSSGFHKVTPYKKQSSEQRFAQPAKDATFSDYFAVSKFLM
jgi:hypothetical protein